MALPTNCWPTYFSLVEVFYGYCVETRQSLDDSLVFFHVTASCCIPKFVAYLETILQGYHFNTFGFFGISREAIYT